MKTTLRTVAKMVFWRKRALLRVTLLMVFLPSKTADLMTEKSFSRRTMSATRRAASAPAPSEIPQSAAFRARTSLTPSPVMATTCPEARRDLTKDCFWSGVTRAKMSCSSTRDWGKVFDFWSEKSTKLVDFRPRVFTVWATVVGLSPEIIFTLTSFFWKKLRRDLASLRSSSERRTKPRSSSLLFRHFLAVRTR